MQYKIQFSLSNEEKMGEIFVDDNFIKIMSETKFIENSLKAQITACFIYNIKDQLPVGNMAELGVYKGGITKFIATLFPNNTVYAFDTFEGMPAEMITSKDHSYIVPGMFNETNLEYLNNPNIVIKKGIFPDTTRDMEEKTFSFVHLDVDIYESTLAGLEYFWPRMVRDGIIILDDFEEELTPGVKLAFYDYFGKNHPPVMPLLNDRGVVQIRKEM